MSVDYPKVVNLARVGTGTFRSLVRAGASGTDGGPGVAAGGGPFWGSRGPAGGALRGGPEAGGG